MNTVIGVILAGGRGQRMGGVDKAQLELSGVPFWSIILEKLSGMSDKIIVTGPAPPNWLENAPSSLEFVTDVTKDGAPLGPAGGLQAALEYARQTHGEGSRILTVPVDAPYFPEDLSMRLSQTFEDGFKAAIVDAENRLQPTFGLWSACLSHVVKKEINADNLALHRIAKNIGAQTVFFTDSGNSFFNINTHEELDRAHKMTCTALKTNAKNLKMNEK